MSARLNTPVGTTTQAGWFLAVLLALMIMTWFDGWILHHGQSLAAWFKVQPGWFRGLVRQALNCFYIGYGLAFVVGLVKKQGRLVRMGLAYLAGQLVFSLAVGQVLKNLIGRPRPFMGDLPWRSFTFDSDFQSMPSGHSADAALGLMVALLLVRSRLFRVGAVLVAVTAMAGRIIQQAHYATDIAAGFALGCLGAIIAVRWANGAAASDRAPDWIK